MKDISVSRKLEDLVLSHSNLTDNIYAGYMDKNKTRFTQKVDITYDFIRAVIFRFRGSREVIHDDFGKKYEIIVRELHE